jgi:hypothetical protein
MDHKVNVYDVKASRNSSIRINNICIKGQVFYLVPVLQVIRVI